MVIKDELEKITQAKRSKAHDAMIHNKILHEDKVANRVIKYAQDYFIDTQRRDTINDEYEKDQAIEKEDKRRKQ